MGLLTYVDNANGRWCLECNLSNKPKKKTKYQTNQITVNGYKNIEHKTCKAALFSKKWQIQWYRLTHSRRDDSQPHPHELFSKKFHVIRIIFFLAAIMARYSTWKVNKICHIKGITFTFDQHISCCLIWIFSYFSAKWNAVHLSFWRYEIWP